MGVFKAYDIRGIYGENITEELFEKIGKSLNVLGEVNNLVIGCDMRDSSIPLKKALIKGANDSGINVLDIGLASTPMLYQASADFDVDLGIIITASHNSKEYNGMKICRKNAVPISYDTGINKIEERVKKNLFEINNQKGTSKIKDGFKDKYISQLEAYSKPNKKPKIVFDSGNGMGGFVDFEILKNYAEVIPLYTELDGNFPNHEANPIKEENLKDLAKKVLEEKADFGVSFDGDADRIGLVDEKGKYIPADVFGGFLIEYFIKNNPQEKTYSYDLRSTMSVQELLDKNNKIGFKTRVGHSYIKDLMREKKSFFSMELSGHMYFWFSENLVYDSALRATIEVINAYSIEDKALSEILLEFEKYPKSPEINFEVSNKKKILNEIKENFSNLKTEEIDGISIEDESWWANIRESNTEDILRLNLEAKDKGLYESKLQEIKNIINNG